MTQSSEAPKSALGKYIAVLFWAKDQEGEDDVAILVGKVVKGDGYYVDRGENRELFELVPDWYPRIERVEETARDVLRGADFVLHLRVGDVDDGEAEDLIPLGLKWPTKE